MKWLFVKSIQVVYTLSEMLLLHTCIYIYIYIYIWHMMCKTYHPHVEYAHVEYAVLC